VSTRTLRILTALLVGAIALIAFAVSFEAISAYAAGVGAFPHSLRWCAPLLVDTFTVAACLVILARSRDGVRAVYAWSLVVTASTVSVALNVAHAPPHTAARLVAALPPAALLAALELVMSEARRLRVHPPPRSPRHPVRCRTPPSAPRVRWSGNSSPATRASVRSGSWRRPGWAAGARTSCSPRCGPRATGRSRGEDRPRPAGATRGNPAPTRGPAGCLLARAATSAPPPSRVAARS
jgi:hypothetical protein